MKTCNKCKMEIPATPEYFHRNKKHKDGLVNMCKECANKKSQKHYQKNKEKKHEYDRKYYQENKEEILEYNKKYYQENKKKYREYFATYRLENPESSRLSSQRRRARMAQLPHTLTVEEWEEALEYFDYSCAYCGVPEDNIGKEHVIPVSKGGGYTVDNIIPACRTCNASKYVRDLEEWYLKYEHYDEGRLNKILDYIEVMEVAK